MWRALGAARTVSGKPEAEADPLLTVGPGLP